MVKSDNSVHRTNVRFLLCINLKEVNYCLKYYYNCAIIVKSLEVMMEKRDLYDKNRDLTGKNATFFR